MRPRYYVVLTSCSPHSAPHPLLAPRSRSPFTPTATGCPTCGQADPPHMGGLLFKPIRISRSNRHSCGFRDVIGTNPGSNLDSCERLRATGTNPGSNPHSCERHRATGTNPGSNPHSCEHIGRQARIRLESGFVRTASGDGHESRLESRFVRTASGDGHESRARIGIRANGHRETGTNPGSTLGSCERHRATGTNPGSTLDSCERHRATGTNPARDPGFVRTASGDGTNPARSGFVRTVIGRQARIPARIRIRANGIGIGRRYARIPARIRIRASGIGRRARILVRIRVRANGIGRRARIPVRISDSCEQHRETGTNPGSNRRSCERSSGDRHESRLDPGFVRTASGDGHESRLESGFVRTVIGRQARIPARIRIRANGIAMGRRHESRLESAFVPAASGDGHESSFKSAFVRAASGDGHESRLESAFVRAASASGDGHESRLESASCERHRRRARIPARIGVRANGIGRRACESSFESGFVRTPSGDGHEFRLEIGFVRVLDRGPDDQGMCSSGTRTHGRCASAAAARVRAGAHSCRRGHVPAAGRTFRRPGARSGGRAHVPAAARTFLRAGHFRWAGAGEAHVGPVCRDASAVWSPAYEARRHVRFAVRPACRDLDAAARSSVRAPNWSIGRDQARIAELNPLGQVPVLVLDDGEPLVESAVILDYLDQLVGPARALVPASGEARRRVLGLTALAAGVADKARLQMYERVFRPAGLQHEPLRLRLRAQMLATCERLEETCAGRGGAEWLVRRPDHAGRRDARLRGDVRERDRRARRLGALPALRARHARISELRRFARSTCASTRRSSAKRAARARRG